MIIAIEERYLRIAFERQNVRCDPVEEPAIMGNHQHTTGEFKQRVFECAQRLDVKIVRRFIEQQHITALQQRLREMQTAAFAAGQIADDFLLVAAFEIESAQIGA